MDNSKDRMGRIVKIPALVLLEICHCLLLVLGASYLSDSFLRTEMPSPLSKWISQKCSSVFLKLQNQIYDTYVYILHSEKLLKGILVGVAGDGGAATSHVWLSI